MRTITAPVAKEAEKLATELGGRAPTRPRGRKTRLNPNPMHGRRSGWRPPQARSSEIPLKKLLTRARGQTQPRGTLNGQQLQSNSYLSLAKTVGGNSSALAAVLPHSHTTRYQAAWTNTATSVASPFIISTVDFSATKGVSAELGNGCVFAAISRDPLNARIEYVPNPTAKIMSYEFRFPSWVDHIEKTPVITNRRWIPDINVPAAHNLNPAYAVDLHVGDANYIHPHGTTTFMRSYHVEPQTKYFYLTKNEGVQLAFWDDAIAANCGGYVTLKRAIGDGSLETQTLKFGSAAVPPLPDVSNLRVFAPESGNYAIEAAFSAFPISVVDRFNVTMNMEANVGAPAPIHSHMGHLPIPGIESRNLLSAIRVNGAALMVTPDSALLARGGRVAGVQVDTTFVVESLVKNSNSGPATNPIENLPDANAMSFDQGGYAWHKPRSNDSYARQLPFRHNGDYSPRAVGGSNSVALTVCNYFSAMDPPDGWLVYGVNTPPGAAGASSPFPGGLAHFTYSFSIEYWHYDLWIGKQLPPMGAAEYDMVMQKLQTCAQFHTNALHIADLKRWYNGVSPHVRRIAPSLFSLLTMLGPKGAALAAAGEAIGTILPNEI